MKQQNKLPDNIATLVEKFMQGTTTLAEEELLYEFFRSAEVGQEYSRIKDMFCWYGDQKCEPAEDCVISVPQNSRGQKARSWIAAAASLVVLTVGAIFMINHERPLPEHYLAYQGSYIIKNGKKITDLRIVVPEIERTQRIIDQSLKSANEALEAAEHMDFEQEVMRALSDCDPVVRKAALETINF